MKQLTTPKAGELWGHKSPVFVIKPRGRKFVLATLHVDPDAPEYTADRLAKKFRELGYKRVGRVV